MNNNMNAQGMISIEEYLLKRRNEKKDTTDNSVKDSRAAELTAALELALLYV